MLLSPKPLPNRKGKINPKRSKIQAAHLDKVNTNNDTIFVYDLANNSADDAWTTKTGKRNLSDSLNANFLDSGSNISKNKNVFVTENRHEALMHTDFASLPKNNPVLDTTTIANQIKLPPPIFVKGIINLSDLCTTLIELIEADNVFCKSFFRFP